MWLRRRRGWKSFRWDTRNTPLYCHFYKYRYETLGRCVSYCPLELLIIWWWLLDAHPSVDTVRSWAPSANKCIVWIERVNRNCWFINCWQSIRFVYISIYLFNPLHCFLMREKKYFYFLCEVVYNMYLPSTCI